MATRPWNPGRAGPAAASGRSAALPVVLIAGYLGAGKTSLVNRLLREAGGRRLAVLVNDFGDTPIDADLIAAHLPGGAGDAAADAADAADGVLTLAGGCLCCSFGDDLVGTLGRVAERHPPPDLVLIELSGVAEPGPVRRTLALQPRVHTVATWVVVDQARIRRLAADLYLGDVVQAQLQAADWLLLNKADLADDATREALPAWLAGQAPGARQLDGPVQRLPAGLLLDAAIEAAAPAAAEAQSAAAADQNDVADAADAAGQAVPSAPTSGARGRVPFAPRPIGPLPSAQPAAALFEHREWPLPEGTDLAALGAALARPDSGVLRAKALSRDAAGRCWLLQVADEQWTVQPADGVTGASRLVLIGRRGQLPAGPGWPGLATAASGPNADR